MTTVNAQNSIPPGYKSHSGNPILPGYFADPSIVQNDGKAFIYATLDPWGGQALGCWESSDYKNWTYHILNWPTKKACTSSTSKGAMVWAPSVVCAPDGKFYMYVSVGNEVWAGVAENPLGPWSNLLVDKPLIASNYKPGFHMIDAEAFIDEDGSAWLYWGSGLNWKNGKCWAVKLKPDMMTFEGDAKDITPSNYFEAPFMMKHGGCYYLMYSAGNTTQESYRVHYAVGDNPMGPFVEPSNSPILVTDKANNVISPGHHTVFTRDGQYYIMYHRQSIPFDPQFIGRQLCVDILELSPDGLMKKVVPTHTGPPLVQGRATGRSLQTEKAIATASSQFSPDCEAERVLDDNYATRWAAAKDAQGAWLQLDLGRSRMITCQELRMEYAWKPHSFRSESSTDGKGWTTMKDHTQEPAIGSPIIIEVTVKARFLRLVFPESVKGADISLFEWLVK